MALQALEGDAKFIDVERSADPNQMDLNVQIAEHMFFRILLARFLVFSRFLSQIRRLSGDISTQKAALLRRQWTFLQLQPEICVQEDVFTSIALGLLSAASLNYLKMNLLTIRTECFAATKSAHFFFILDEGQTLGTRFLSHFRSSTNDPRSILKYVIKAWKFLPEPTILVSGTGLSLEVLSESVHSNSVKPAVNWRIFTDIGYFKDVQLHNAYIINHVWPNRLLSCAQLAVLDRCWRWLRGRSVYPILILYLLIGLSTRHRFTTAFIQLLKRFPHSPHRLLDRYIYSVTSGFKATDGQSFVEEEEELSRQTIDAVSSRWLSFSKLDKPDNISLYQDIHTKLMMFALRGDFRLEADDQVMRMIDLGIARIGSPSQGYIAEVLEKRTRLDIIMDEPLAIAALLFFFDTTKGHKGLEGFLSYSLGNSDVISRGAAFVHATMFILAHILDGTRTFDEVFDIHNRCGLEEYSGKVQLVSILGWEGNDPIVCNAGLREGASPVIGYAASSPEDVHSWTIGSGTPFLLPDSRMGPDVCALAKVGDSYLYVLLQDKCMKASLRRAEMKKSIKTVTPNQWYTDKVRISFHETYDAHIWLYRMVFRTLTRSILACLIIFLHGCVFRRSASCAS
jgi:hypothetical protein